ncbi:MAG TPA: nuclear transport factor 2 family protein [Woeseiaceae bacterium]|nr:nuclear transport factor 2 family protein [Woeseiaceae bacterium]
MRYADDLADWLEQLFRTIDDTDADAFVQFMTSDCTYRFGAAAPLRGHAAIREATVGFFATIAGLRHRLHRTWQDEDSVVCEGSVTYRRLDGSEITLPFCNVFVLSDGLIQRYSIYADLNPLYAD